VADFAAAGFDVATTIDRDHNPGWSVAHRPGQDHFAIFEPVAPVRGEGRSTLVFTLEHRSLFPGCLIGKFRLSVTATPGPAGGKSLPGNVRGILALDPARRTDEHRKDLAAYFRTVTPLLRPLREELADCRTRRAELLRHVPTTLVTVAGPPRVVRVLP